MHLGPVQITLARGQLACRIEPVIIQLGASLKLVREFYRLQRLFHRVRLKLKQRKVNLVIDYLYFRRYVFILSGYLRLD